MHVAPVANPFRATRRAFTLIELLTVIAIIGILAAIIIPTVSKVRQSARNAQCVARLREWGRAIHLYANDNKNQYRIANWLSAASNPYQPYFPGKSANMDTIRSMGGCPIVNVDLTSGSMSYSMIWPSTGDINTLAGGNDVPLNKISNPAGFLMMCDSMTGSSPRIRGRDSDVGGDLTTMLAPMLGGTNPGTRGDDTVALRHGGRKINGVFADGSVRGMTNTPAGSGDTSSIYEMRPKWFLMN